MDTALGHPCSYNSQTASTLSRGTNIKILNEKNDLKRIICTDLPFNTCISIFLSWLQIQLMKLVYAKFEPTSVYCLWKLLSRDYVAYLRNILCSDMNKHFQGY